MRHVSGLWEGAGAPGRDHCMHEENMQTQLRTVPAQVLNCEARVPTTTPRAAFVTDLISIIKQVNKCD